jgi:predicted hydrocarbon binding protein
MDRKEFIQKTLFSGAVCACGMGMVSGAKGFGQETAKAEDSQDPQGGFRREWVKTFLANLDSSMDESSRVRFMEACGRDCAKRGAIRMAEPFMGNIDGLISALFGHLGKDNIRREGGVVTLQYPECYCPMVSKIKDKLSDTWCHCSKGWVLEMFGIAAGKPVEVKLVQSIKRGDPICRFEILV